MRKNCERAYKAWSDGRALRPAPSIWSDGNTLWSYWTAIAAVDPARSMIVLNRTSYSKTTTIHQNALAYVMRFEDYVLVEVDDVPKGASPEVMVALARNNEPVS